MQTNYNRISEHMDKDDISKATVAAGVGVTSRSIDNWYNNVTQPNALWLLKIAAFLDVPFAELLPKENPFHRVLVNSKGLKPIYIVQKKEVQNEQG